MFEEITLGCPDGYECYARLFSADTCLGSVLYLHGIQSHSGWYEESARRLQQAGFTVLQLDRRGSGRNQRDRGHADSSEQLIADAFAGLDVLEARTCHRRHHLLGVSWGGKLAAAMHVTRPERSASLILVTPGLYPKIGVSKSEMFRIGLSMLGAPHRLYDIPLNDVELFTRVPERLQFLSTDPLQIHQATAGFYLASRRMDRVWKELGTVKPVPLHLLLAEDERIIDNESTRNFVRGIHWPGTRITTYLNSRHTLEFDPDRESYLQDLVEWMGQPEQAAKV